MEKIKISIIISVYNVVDYLADCLNSVLNQTFRDIEVLLIDDGSTDGSSELCDRFANIDGRIRVHHISNHGLAYTRNMGIKIANGEYIGFVDPDDYIKLDMFEKLYNLCIKHEVKLAMCNTFRQTKNGDFLSKDTNEEKVLSGLEFFQILMVRCYFSVWNKLWHRSLFDTIVFPENMESGSDLYTYKLIYIIDKFAYLTESLYYYTKRQSSLCHIGDIKNRECRIQAVQNMISDIHKNRPNLQIYGRYLLWSTRLGYLEILLMNEKQNIELSKFHLNAFKKELQTIKSLLSFQFRLRSWIIIYTPQLYKQLYL